MSDENKTAPKRLLKKYGNDIYHTSAYGVMLMILGVLIENHQQKWVADNPQQAQQASQILNVVDHPVFQKAKQDLDRVIEINQRLTVSNQMLEAKSQALQMELNFAERDKELAVKAAVLDLTPAGTNPGTSRAVVREQAAQQLQMQTLEMFAPRPAPTPVPTPVPLQDQVALPPLEQDNLHRVPGRQIMWEDDTSLEEQIRRSQSRKAGKPATTGKLAVSWDERYIYFTPVPEDKTLVAGS